MSHRDKSPLPRRRRKWKRQQPEANCHDGQSDEYDWLEPEEEEVYTPPED